MVLYFESIIEDRVCWKQTERKTNTKPTKNDKLTSSFCLFCCFRPAEAVSIVVFLFFVKFFLNFHYIYAHQFLCLHFSTCTQYTKFDCSDLCVHLNIKCIFFCLTRYIKSSLSVKMWRSAYNEWRNLRKVQSGIGRNRFDNFSAWFAGKKSGFIPKKTLKISWRTKKILILQKILGVRISQLPSEIPSTNHPNNTGWPFKSLHPHFSQIIPLEFHHLGFFFF